MFGAHWISHPQPDSLSHIWFRKAYLSDGRPQEAHITVVSTGYYKLYVNQCNVGTALFYPAREPYSDQPVGMTFDVTPYLRPDTNVIALCYSPTHPHQTSRQISVVCFGTSANGTRFSHVSDGNWLCRHANSSLTADGREIIDGRYHDPSWNGTEFAAAQWISADESDEGEQPSDTLSYPTPSGMSCPSLPQLSHTRGYNYFDAEADTVAYEFDTGFIGMLRLTLREARPSEHIMTGNFEYICNGEMDEQACPVFQIRPCRRIRVYGDQHFKRSQIVFVEALETTQINSCQLFAK